MKRSAKATARALLAALVAWATLGGGLVLAEGAGTEARPVAPAGPAATSPSAVSEQGPLLRLIDRTVFCPTPRQGTRTGAVAGYTRARGLEMVRTRGTMTRSDTADTCEYQLSSDNGKSWSPPVAIPTHLPHPRGTLRRHPRIGFVDPVMDRYVSFMTEGVLPNDRPMEGMKNWTIRYSVSLDGGRTRVVDEQVIQKGAYTPEHPMEGVWVGRNGVMIGDLACQPIRTRGGKILVPIQICPVGPDGHYYNPGGGLSYHVAGVLIGTWRSTPGDYRLDWELSEMVKNDPALSTRGCVEPTIAQFPDGRILMVLRGSNDVKPRLPGYRWYSVSNDEGKTWSAVRPWTYSDGAAFFSPSSCSQLLEHSSGRYFWLGNITPSNPNGNRPRFPMTIGEVDPQSLLLKRETVTVIDTRRPGDSAAVMLSNFHAHEDRVTGDIHLHMSRPFARAGEGWTSDAYLYRIGVNAAGGRRAAEGGGDMGVERGGDRVR